LVVFPLYHGGPIIAKMSTPNLAALIDD
jgi:hypothetical protein